MDWGFFAALSCYLERQEGEGELAEKFSRSGKDGCLPLSVFESGIGLQAKWLWVSPAASRPQGWLNLRPTASPAETG